MRFAAIVGALGLSASAPQPPTTKLSTPPCSPVESAVTIRLLDAAGAAVDKATMHVIREQDGKRLRDGEQMRARHPEYIVLQSDALTWLAAKGERIRIEATSGNRKGTAVIVVGKEKTQCVLARLSGPDSLVLK